MIEDSQWSENDRVSIHFTKLRVFNSSYKTGLQIHHFDQSGDCEIMPLGYWYHPELYRLTPTLLKFPSTHSNLNTSTPFTSYNLNIYMMC